MEYMPWKSEYSVKNDEMDKQHQVLVGMINQLHEAMKTGKGKTESLAIVQKMIEYSAFHFEAEEKYMSKIGFSKIAAHQKEHQAFMQKANDFKKQLDLGSLSLSIDLSNFLKDWLTSHILVNDMEYSKI